MGEPIPLPGVSLEVFFTKVSVGVGGITGVELTNAYGMLLADDLLLPLVRARLEVSGTGTPVPLVTTRWAV